ncbi:hypothetical protein [Marinitoga lauensis]|uniref:hypothetical protein n=1 Tax=Marinitoga lauensis TaxID=2201189 RepID=UPI001013BB26|nr:hypothetical protein [Marinitoga lauensis]
MKKVFLSLFLLLYVAYFGYTSFNFSFIFTFGSTQTTYSQYVKIHYIDDSQISTITFNFKKYPQTIIIGNEEYTVFSKEQKFITGSGKLNIIYNNKKYEFLLENEKLELGLDHEIFPYVKILYYTKNISPNNDWYNDNLKITLYSNTYGFIELFDKKKTISPGKNEIYYPVDLSDGPYTKKLIIYNSAGKYEKDLTFKVDRSKKTITKYVVLSILGLFLGFILFNL